MHSDRDYFQPRLGRYCKRTHLESAQTGHTERTPLRVKAERRTIAGPASDPAGVGDTPLLVETFDEFGSQPAHKKTHQEITRELDFGHKPELNRKRRGQYVGIDVAGMVGHQDIVALARQVFKSLDRYSHTLQK